MSSWAKAASGRMPGIGCTTALTSSPRSSLGTPSGMAALNAEVTRQAAMLAYIDDFELIMWIALAATPLLLL
jgi:hypothetical protein